MPRQSSPPRLWLRRSRQDASGKVTHMAKWYIRYRGLCRPTRFGENEKCAAESYLQRLLDSPGSIENKLKAKRKPGISKVSDIFGEIYFISAEHNPNYPVKIGFSFDDVYMRLKNIQVGSPEKLFVITTFTAHYSVEIELHSILSEDRIIGEWFRRSDSVVGAINAAKCGTLKAWMASRLPSLSSNAA